ncbi:T9SS type A sorting domain-containing protein, partial [candidate division WOR-3 bacterium]|nr:T9SS type A sorting domain-containing protein [candidate division WOR-3 bacterium]
ILYSIPEETKCNIDVFDISGRRIKTLKDKIVKPGHHTVEWNGRNNDDKQVASGIYFYRLKTNNYSKMRKILFIK